MNAGIGFKESDKEYPYEWLGPKEAERFAEFLEYLNQPDNGIQEVVIIGDLMDNWVYPVDVEPPSLQKIISAPINKKIVRALKKLAKNENIKVLYLPGNHDMEVTEGLLKKNFPGSNGSPGIVFGGTAFRNSIYRTSRLRAEHGSGHAMFNAPDPINNPINRLPLGYFISRVVATNARNTGSSKRHYWRYADDLLEIFGPQRLGNASLKRSWKRRDSMKTRK